MRSKLFVPGTRPELFAKAMAGEADAVSIDLEDSIAEDRKGEARSHASAFLQSAQVRAASKPIIVRSNALNSRHFEADVLAIAQPGLALLNVPKLESREDVLAAIAALEKAEVVNGVKEPIRVLANIETPRGLRFATEIAASHRRVAGLQIGYGDLFEPLGIDRHDVANVHAAMFVVRMAAGAADVFAYDGAFTDLGDTQGLRAEAQMARRLGFWGKSCIHPRQIALVNEVFQPTAAEIAFARRVLEAARHADTDGAGVFVVDGRMIDKPFLRRAEAIVAAHRSTLPDST
jgi:citrate lyase beta subunit